MYSNFELRKKKRVATVSYGKDSLGMLEIIYRNGLPLDRIVHVEIMATPDIHADLPPMLEFKKKADKIIKERYGIEVEHLSAPKSYEEYFYTVKNGERVLPKNFGKIWGFPTRAIPWCNSRLKLSALREFNRKDIIRYIGIAADEPKRFHNLTDRQHSPLVEFGITEKWCWEWCEKNGLLSPIYQTAQRGGCWFCHNQRIGQLRTLRKEYPEYWDLLLKWDQDSPGTFRPNCTVQDLEKRFAEEDRQLTLF